MPQGTGKFSNYDYIVATLTTFMSIAFMWVDYKFNTTKSTVVHI